MMYDRMYVYAYGTWCVHTSSYIIHNVCQRARGVCVHNMFRHEDTSMHIQYAYVV